MMKLAQILMLLMCLAGVASGQCKDGKPHAASGFKSLVKFEGWEIPGLNASKVLIVRQLWKENKEPVPVYVTVLKPEEKVIIEVPSYSVDDCQNLYLSVNRVSVERVSQFDLAGRVFCYVIEVNLVGAAADYYVLFYDEDGDGKFEKFERGRPEPRVPVWALGRR